MRTGKKPTHNWAPAPMLRHKTDMFGGSDSLLLSLEAEYRNQMLTYLIRSI